MGRVRLEISLGNSPPCPAINPWFSHMVFPSHFMGISRCSPTTMGLIFTMCKEDHQRMRMLSQHSLGRSWRYNWNFSNTKRCVFEQLCVGLSDGAYTHCNSSRMGCKAWEFWSSSVGKPSDRDQISPPETFEFDLFSLKICCLLRENPRNNFT